MAQSSREEKKNFVEMSKVEGKSRLLIRLVDSSGGEVAFQIKPTTRLKKIKDAFCTNRGLGHDTIRLSYDGKRIDDTDTAGSLGLEDRDVIDVFTEQTGGGGKNLICPHLRLIAISFKCVLILICFTIVVTVITTFVVSLAAWRMNVKIFGFAGKDVILYYFRWIPFSVVEYVLWFGDMLYCKLTSKKN